MSHIFISYSHKDKAYVHKLQEALQKEGFEVWIDDRIDYGEEWPAEIEWRLDNCEAFIVVVSSNAKKSKWVQNEVRRAERKGLPMFPLLLEGEPWLFIETIQWFDVAKGKIPDEKFFRRLANFANRNRPVVAEEPKPVPVQKSPRKWDTRIIAAIAGVVIIFTAIFGLPWKKWLVTATDIFTSSPTNPDADVIIDDKGVVMRLVLAGEFTMGSEGGSSDEKPVHQVYLDAFYMDIYEVTNALYKICVKSNSCSRPKNVGSYDDPDYEDRPVDYVDWYQAKTYCEWRKADLPTEAQWEKAARGTDGRTYPWGEGLDCYKANYQGCTENITSVGSYKSGKSPYDIYDMAGNVWEWTADWYSGTYYQDSPFKNPLGPDTGQYRVLRGGSWISDSDSVRSTYRGWDFPTYSGYYIGFRCVRDTTP